MVNIKSNGQRRVFISHRHEDYPIAYAAGRFHYRPQVPHPPVEVTYKARPVNVFGQYVVASTIHTDARYCQPLGCRSVAA